MKRLLTPVIGAALLAGLAAAPTGQAWDWYSKRDGLKKAAAGLRQLAGQAPPSDFSPDTGQNEYASQTAWLRKAASRCDALAKKLEASGGKSDSKSSKEFLSPNKVADEVPGLRSSLEKENADFSFRSPQAKARQEEAVKILKALGE